MKYKNKETEDAHKGEFNKKFGSDVARQARRKLETLSKTKKLEDLRNPPGNNLEALQGNRKGQHSIRINDQWRICFKWTDDGAVDVEVTDYH